MASNSWGEGSDSVALFKNLCTEEEKALIDANRTWIQRKADAGFAGIAWERRWGGQGLLPDHERAFTQLEREYLTPEGHSAIDITRGLLAQLIHAVGTDEQRTRFLPAMLRTDQMWCQLFSEPGSGSDLAGITTAAVANGDQWLVNGQKVWSSGAQYADLGVILCRSDPSVPKHRGITAFVVPMSAPGVEVRPLRQMTGGIEFNEVFFTDVAVPDEYRLGDVGMGWPVALTTLGFERSAFGLGAVGAWNCGERLLALARHLDRGHEPVIRQLLAAAYTHERLVAFNDRRIKDRIAAGEVPGPEGSIGKLAWLASLHAYNRAAESLLGPRLTTDSGEWGTYAWSEHLLGTAGYRIAGGSDEVQRNIIGERVLGLPPEPRIDRDRPFRDVPR